MAKKTPEPVDIETEPEAPKTLVNGGNFGEIVTDIAELIESFFHAHLAPTVPPKYYAATEDPDHPLHYHSKPTNVPAKD